MRLTIKIGSGSTIHEEVHESMAVLDLKALIEDTTGIAVHEQRLLFRGRALHDEDTLEAAHVSDEAQLYVAVHAGVPSENLNASSFVPTPGDPPVNNDPTAGLLNSPFMQGMLDNPEMLRTMMQANPQMRQIMDNNPELAHVLNDPATLRQSLQSARNPQLMREQMRHTDRAMSNLEAHPGGHNLLRRMYDTVQAPMSEITPAGMLAPAEGEGQGASNAAAAQGPASGPNTSALPNPWASPPSQSNLPGAWRPPGGPGGWPFNPPR